KSVCLIFSSIFEPVQIFSACHGDIALPLRQEYVFLQLTCINSLVNWRLPRLVGRECQYGNQRFRYGIRRTGSSRRSGGCRTASRLRRQRCKENSPGG